jgi:hypothetical protein
VSVTASADPAGSEGRLSCRHPRGDRGSFDESARRVSWPELEVGQRLAAEGHRVRSIPDGRGRGKTADFDVCGVATEVKTLNPRATSSTLDNALRRGRDQGELVIVNASASGLARHWAERGVNEFASGARLGKLQAVRVIGAGFEFSYSRTDLLRIAERGGPERSIGG